MLIGLTLFAQAAATASPFDWKEGLYVLLIVLVALGGLLLIEAIHLPAGQRAARPRPAPRAREGRIDQSGLAWTERVAWGRALLAGVLGTGALSVFALLAAAAGLPKLDPAAMLASMLGDNLALGWLAHFMIGIALAWIYALWFAAPLNGPWWARGAVFSLLPFFAAQLVVVPLMGGGFFSAALPQAGALVTLSLVGHLLYGIVLGGVYAAPPGTRAEPSAQVPEQRPQA